MDRSELRTDPWTGAVVLIAPHRDGIGSTKPMHVALPAVPPDRCPFCPGHEADTEATLEQIPTHGSWRARAVANRFPLVAAHELIVDHPDHHTDWSTFDDAHATALYGLYRRRIAALAARPDSAQVTFFRNRGRAAGSSQPHPHAQVLASTWVPPEVALRERHARAHHATRGETLLATLIAETLAGGSRLVFADDDVAVLCPHAPHRPHELWIAPRAGGGDLGAAASLDAALGRAVAHATRALAAAFGDGDRNLLARTFPVAQCGEPHATFHLEIHPRGKGGAGFELATGVDVVTVAPEESAARLRSVW